MTPTPHTPGTGSPRILIVRVGAMGDVLHGMPAVAALRAALPNAHIDWAIEPRWASLLSAIGAAAGTLGKPLVHGIHRVNAKQWSKKPFSFATIKSIAALRSVLRRDAYDIAIDLQGTIRSAVIARMSGAKRVIGSASPREGVARLLYTERVRLTTPHVVEQATELVSRAVGWPLMPADAPLPIDLDGEIWCDDIIGEDERTVLLAPTAGWGAKQWPAEHYGEVAQAFAVRGYRVLVNAAPRGVDAVAHAVIRASRGAATALPCTLPQLIALLRRTELVIAGDTGPLHLAAALHVPVVGLFGPTDPDRNGPWGNASRVLRNHASVTDHHRYSMVEAGLAAITANEVVTAALDVLQSVDAPRHR